MSDPLGELGKSAFGLLADLGVETVHINAPALEDSVIAFAHIRAIGADHVDMLPRAEPSALEQRLRRHRGVQDDVCFGHCLFEIGCGFGVGAVCRKGLGLGLGAIPDREARAWEPG